MIFHENRLPAILMKYHGLFVIFGKATKLKLSSAANFRWRFKKNLSHMESVLVLFAARKTNRK